MAAALRAFLKGRPLLANCATYGTLYAGAEFSQQTILRKALAEKPEDYDLPLVGRYFVLGSTAFPTLLYYWYKVLDGKLVGTATKTVVSKVFIDQAVSAPVILFIFYTGMSLMEGRDDIFKELREKFWPTFGISCCFWVPTQCLNFKLVPPKYRVVFVAIANFAWVNILCTLKRQSASSNEEA